MKTEQYIITDSLLRGNLCVEAIAFHRPYRPSLGIYFALEEISRNKGILYDADAVDACLKLFQEKSYTLLVLKK